ncbi:DUF2771 domain-containing protein [Corynebacterium lubricantis]|uniref:DUF2771 domain-containing protein n=1 Tax=Corynebacterium lubricantis TaxID=541095 RepID=UPI0003810B07|nr:DUF2771 domain-containing protein [Corynebacterium lubricantis]
MAKKKSSSLQLLALIVVMVLVMVVGAYGIMTWQKNRPPTPPQEVAITVSAGDESLEATPYLVCEPGVECPEGEIPTLKVASGDTVNVEIPEDIYDHDWTLLTIYDDPGANDEQVHGPYDTDSVDIPVSATPVGDSAEQPQLVVIEVSSIMIGLDDNNEESPYLVTWSIAVEQ